MKKLMMILMLFPIFSEAQNLASGSQSCTPTPTPTCTSTPTPTPTPAVYITPICFGLAAELDILGLQISKLIKKRYYRVAETVHMETWEVAWQLTQTNAQVSELTRYYATLVKLKRKRFSSRRRYRKYKELQRKAHLLLNLIDIGC